jgi:hypothetical protein
VFDTTPKSVSTNESFIVPLGSTAFGLGQLITLLMLCAGDVQVQHVVVTRLATTLALPAGLWTVDITRIGRTGPV